ncbi:hypothetical protein S40288_04346 [Stachybotrys chartarum IBT 40288]|nr:hypothetical protein S40288_04346 [Stachybotrys chartarum IBT 40288]
MAPKPAAAERSDSLPKKRKGAPAGASNARSDGFNQKRAKMTTARKIPAQPADAALKDGQLDLQAFVAAHEFEIRSLEQSMASSKAVLTSRVFQQVPRDLRRRTASHNPKRVPKRLQARARKEMAIDNAPLVEARSRRPRTTRAKIRAETARRLGILAARKKRRRLKEAKAAGRDPSAVRDEAVVGRTPRPKIRRDQLNDPPKPVAKFRKRQIHKTWLPTHMWHAKRARMTEPKSPFWRFAIPLTPNDKIYRPTHRAQGNKGTLIWDMSYMSTIGVSGGAAGLERVLRRVGVTQTSCWNDKGKVWRQGVRSWSGLLSKEANGSIRHMCAATILWNPKPREPVEMNTKGVPQQQIFIRVHPSAFLEVFHELIRLVKMEIPRVFIEDLRYEIGSIELTGPASTESLLAVLKPYKTKDHPGARHGDLFASLKGLTNPALLPTNAVLGFPIQDPRLTYPPRRVQWPEDDEAQMELLELVSEWPARADLEPYGIFDRNLRHQASCLPSQRAIDKRKTASGPGKYLTVTKSDPRIPIVLLASRSAGGTQAQGTWTLLAPWKCISPIWHSLVHCPLVSGGNPRFAGLNEHMQVAFERGSPWFPADYIWTDAGVQWELEQRRKRKRDWEKRPKSKRTAWESLDLGAGRKGEVGDGLSCDFELLFGLPRPGGEDSSAAQESQGDAMEVDPPSSPKELVSVKPSPPSPLNALSVISKTSFNDLLSSTQSAPPNTKNTLISVRINLVGRGVATTCARVYRLPDQPAPLPTSSDAEVPTSIPPPAASPALPYTLRAQWLAKLSPSSEAQSRPRPPKISKSMDLDARKQVLAQQLTASQPASSAWPASEPPNQNSIGGQHPLIPDAKDLIGFVTTGSFNLSEGRGSAIASLAVDKVLSDVRSSAKHGHFCIVRNAGENVGWLARWEII